MISISKLLSLILIIVVVWLTLRWLERMTARPRANRSSSAPAPQPAPAEDLRRCPVCGVFVPTRGVGACGRAGCPADRTSF